MCVGTASAAGKRRAQVRLAACAINTLTVLLTYFEYLWASEWVDDSAECSAGSLSLLDFLNCLRRYTFSDSMVRRQNLLIWACVGGVTSLIYTILEWRRVEVLRQALYRQLAITAKASEDGSSVRWALTCLSVYQFAALGSFSGVLLLVPFHIDVPLMHYSCAGVLFSLMFLAMTSYIVMPLDFGSSGRDVTVAGFAQRRSTFSPCVVLLVVLQLVAMLVGACRVVAAWTGSQVWSQVAGMMFGFMEVALVIGYQGFVALFAVDDSEVLPVSATGKPLLAQAKVTSPASRKMVGVETSLLVS